MEVYSVLMLTLDANTCRNARLSRDKRFDGQFFLAVTTTGIYCRPICPARPPREENVRYFRTAAEANHSGFRPCLRCRPESAPNSPAWAGTSTTLKRALDMINAGQLNELSMTEFCARLGVGERYLRKLFARDLGVSPAQVAKTQRLHFARKLLAETKMPMADVAFASGYGSLRRFNSAIQDAFQRTPSQLRRDTKTSSGGLISLEMHYRPPLDWPALLDFFDRHSIEGLEAVEANSYWRRFEIDSVGARFTLSPHPDKPCLLLQLENVGTAHLMPVVARVRRMFDLDATPEDIGTDLSRNPLFNALHRDYPGMRSPTHACLFEAAVRAVVGQQVSIKAARGVLAKIVNRCQAQYQDVGLFPQPQHIASLPDDAFAMPRSRKQSLRDLCHCFMDRDHDALSFVDSLADIRGIGPWTIAMIRMRGLGDPDVFPPKDLGLIKAAEARGVDGKQLAEQVEHCSPWRSYAANLLWRDLS